MRFLRTFLPLVAGAFATAAQAGPQPLGTLWSDGKSSIEIVPCTPSMDWDRWCRGISLRHNGKLERLGEGYILVDLLWRNAGDVNGPDAVVRGNSGGSAGDSEIFAVDVSHGLATRKLAMERGDEARAIAGPGPLRIALPFLVGYFNGAPHAQDTIVLVPFRWADGDFRLDAAALAGRSFSPDELQFRELAVREELQRRVQDLYPATTLYLPGAGVSARGGTPVTVYALLDLMLAGRADEARALLHRAWPRGSEGGPFGGEDAFWAGLCRKVVGREDWRKFGFDRLPHADLIDAAARAQAVAVR
jgi:hypothetical protein